jgi:membrane associated rhomboid family serine protease
VGADSNWCVTQDLQPRADTSLRFGTEAFYASIGRALVVMCAVVPVLFAIELLDYWLADDLAREGGIRPRRIEGLDGVVLAPLLHVNFAHLYGNSVPLILLGTFVLASGARRFLASTLFIAVFSGVGVWLVGDPDTVVVGASGVIFGYLGLPGVVDPQVSWQGHLFGFLGGALAAVVFRAAAQPRLPVGA